MFCLNCMSVFEEPSRYEQKSEFWGAPCSEIFYSCPYCDSDDIIDLKHVVKKFLNLVFIGNPSLFVEIVL